MATTNNQAVTKPNNVSDPPVALMKHTHVSDASSLPLTKCRLCNHPVPSLIKCKLCNHVSEPAVECNHVSKPAVECNHVSNPSFQPMHRELFKAASTGDVNLLSNLISADLDILFSVTPHGNNCLHIAVMLGHDKFAREICKHERTSLLLSCTNINGETPLIAALMAANESLASLMIQTYLKTKEGDDIETGKPSNEMMLMVDRRGENALHHALRNCFPNIGVQLLDIETGLAEQVNKSNESPLHIACRRGYLDVVKRLIQIRFSAYVGPNNDTAFDAAIRAHHIDIVKELLKGRPELAYIKNGSGNAALGTAVISEKLEIVKILLQHYPDQAYIQNEQTGLTPFLLAAYRGFVPIAEEIRCHCPDSVYSVTKRNGYNALHEAVEYERPEFLQYILSNPHLHRLINQGNINGELPLHSAANRCDPKALRSLVSHKAQDYSAVNCKNANALGIIYEKTDLFKTLKWTEAFTLLSNAIPSGILNLASDRASKEFTRKAEKDIRSLTQSYTTNTSLVAALLATITFAAAFTLPGGYNSDSSDKGFPIFAKKAAFQIF